MRPVPGEMLSGLKPWEEEWTHGKRGHEMRVMRSAGAGDPLLEHHLAMVYTPSRSDADGIRTWAEADSVADATARLMAAAPDMARALLALLPNGGHARHCQGGNPRPLTGECSDECAAARSALTRAGVSL